MMEEVEKVEELIKEINNSTVFETLAKGYRKMYIALVSNGFSKEEAMDILTSQGLSVDTK